MTETKRCTACGNEKERSAFYRNAAQADGLQSRCKRCHVEANRASRLRHPETNRARHRRYLERNQEQARAAVRAWRRANREKWRAHKAVARAVRTGHLVRPDACTSCGTTNFRIEAHHEDYGQPLTVVWLCSSCHRTTRGAGA